MEVMEEEIIIIEVFGEIFIKTASKEAVSRVVNPIKDIIYYHRFHNKRSAIYMGNLNAS